MTGPVETASVLQPSQARYRMHKTSVTLSAELVQRATAVAERDERNLSSIVRVALRRYLDDLDAVA